MKKRRRRTKTHNATAHHRAVTEPHVRRALSDLQRRWNYIGRVERGDRLHELVNQGCSTRGLADALKVSPTTVRRHLEVASLSAENRQAIERGASAKKLLSANAAARRQRQVRERLLTERRTGQLSDELADIIISFCKAEVGGEVTLSRDELPLFLTSVAQSLQRLARTSAPRQRISRRLSLAEQFKHLKPTRPNGEFWIEQHADWLAGFIWATVPEQQIWENALLKAQKRDRELGARRLTGSRNLGSDVGAIRIITIPARRITRPAREVLKRQGRPTRND